MFNQEYRIITLNVNGLFKQNQNQKEQDTYQN